MRRKAITVVPKEILDSTARQSWKRAYQKALADYGSKSQAERIAWCVVGMERPESSVGLKKKRAA